MVFQSLLSGAHIPPPGGAIGTPLAVGVLALTSGLAATCFVKAFGISFLAMPRSEPAARVEEPHWSVRAVMATLAIACILLGLAAPRAVAGLQLIIGTLLPLATPAPLAAPSDVWLMAPGGMAQVSPLLIAFLLLAVVVIAAAMIRARGLELRYADTWGCGRIRQTPRMEYTSSAFAEPLRRIFSELYRPAEDLSISAHPESRYFVRSITYTSSVVPWFETGLYDPVIRGTRRVGGLVRRLQAGSVHLYLLYVASALMVALASAWWFR
jgi:hypothetical protein